jgi:hypothetical protein
MIYCDNLSSIQLAKNPVFHARTKHIEVHYHFVRERVLSGEVELQYVPTDLQTADIFTKPLGLDKLRQFSGALGLRHLDMPNLRGREETNPNDSDSESRSEKAESDRRFDSDTLNQPRPKRTRRTQRKRQRRDSKEAEKGRVSEQADQKGRCYAEENVGKPTQSEFRPVQKMPKHRTIGVPTRSETLENRSERKKSGNLDIRKKGAGPIYRPDTKEDRAGRVNSAEYNNEVELEADAESDTGSDVRCGKADEWTPDGKPEPEEAMATRRGYGNKVTCRS